MTTSPPGSAIGAPLDELEREIIADIQATCRRFGWPAQVRPNFQTYLDRRGHFYEKGIKRLGGWVRMFDLAMGDERRASATATVSGSFDDVVADVREVAQRLRIKPGARLTMAVYLRSGGIYGSAVIYRAGGWLKVSTAAGFPSTMGGNPTRRRQWEKIGRTLNHAEVEAALDRALGRNRLPAGILRMVGLKRRRGKRPPVRRDVPVLERGEIIADIRQIALGVGLLSPSLLTWETYRAHGGRYSIDHVSAMGGFAALRRAA